MPKCRILALLAIAGLPLSVPCDAEKKPVTLESITAGRQRGGFSPVWSPAGDQFIYIESDTLRLLDCATAKDREIIGLSKLRSMAVRTTDREAGDWTNRNVSADPVQWFPSGNELLVSEAGDLFILPLAPSAGAPSVTQLTSTPESERDAKLSPDGKSVGFRRGHDLYLLRLSDRKLTRLTTDGTATLLNAEMDWVYPEELDLPTAWWWSPDSRHIAYLQFDISREPVFPQVSLLDVRSRPEPERYPQPGDPNADVRVGVVPAEGGPTRWLDVGETRDHLIARVEWLPSSDGVAVQRLNRIQNQLDLLIADPQTGTSRLLLHEEDSKWVNVNDALHFFGDGSRFLWGSERDGFLHLYLYGRDGKLQRQLTKGPWVVDKVLRVDESRGIVYYTSNQASPLETQFYKVSLDGSDPRRLTPEKGVHSVKLSSNFEYWTDSFSSLTTPPQTTLYGPGHRELRVLRKPDASLADWDLQTPEIHSFKTPDGVLLYGRLIKPAGFSAGRKYPVVVEVYGGPHAQSVRDSWMGLSWEQALAQRGFVVWQLDNRGSFGRGHGFEGAVFRNLGERELADQLLGLDYLHSLGFTDPQRVGLYGWSYGGFMTLYSLVNAPDRFRAGVSGAPVTSWRTYDSIYTERYMGLPQENPEAYDKTSPIAHAGNLQAQLLMIHNLEDDNVHFQNSMRMAAALEKAGKKFNMIVYPQRSHGVTGPEHRQMLQSITDFFEQALKSR